MTFEEYQKEAQKTALYPEAYRLVYPALGLAGEAGELANKVKKVLRDHGGRLSEEAREAILAELGDVLWYVAQVATDLGESPEAVAQANLAKPAPARNGAGWEGTGTTANANRPPELPGGGHPNPSVKQVKELHEAFFLL